MSWQAGDRRLPELALSRSESASTGAQTGIKIIEVDVISGNQLISAVLCAHAVFLATHCKKIII